MGLGLDTQDLGLVPCDLVNIPGAAAPGAAAPAPQMSLQNWFSQRVKRTG